MASTRKAAETFTRNAFETTLSSTFGATDTTATVASTSGLTSPCYLVINLIVQHNVSMYFLMVHLQQHS